MKESHFSSLFSSHKIEDGSAQFKPPGPTIMTRQHVKSAPKKSAPKSFVISHSFSVAFAFAALGVTFPQAAKADELEDMLVRLAAAANGQSGSGSLTNIVGSNGITGAIVSGSANGSQGIMALNQDAGPGGATQANIVVVALSTGPNAAALARLLAEQVYEGTAPTPSPSAAVLPTLAALAIIDSYKGGSGIAQINQSAGEGNVQRNATLIAAALGGGDAFAVSETDLATLGTINRAANEATGQRGIASISGSFTDFSGIAQVNQTIGTGNVVSNTVSFTYAGAPVGGG
jgi:hypothetical protein